MSLVKMIWPFLEIAKDPLNLTLYFFKHFTVYVVLESESFNAKGFTV